MYRPQVRNIPITLDGLNQKLDFEIKRLVREKEEGIARYISRTSSIHGTSRLIFKTRNGAKITLSYRLDKGGTLRFAREKQFFSPPPDPELAHIAQVGRASEDITSQRAHR